MLIISIVYDSYLPLDATSLIFQQHQLKKTAVRNKGDLIDSSPASCSCDESSSRAEEKCVSSTHYRSSSFTAQICQVECEGMPKPLSLSLSLSLTHTHTHTHTHSLSPLLSSPLLSSPVCVCVCVFVCQSV